MMESTSGKLDSRPIWLCWFVLAFFGLQTVWEAWTYIFGDTDLFSSIFHDKYVRHMTLVRVHALAGGLTILTSLPAFLPVTRRVFVHRWLGKAFILSVLVAGLSALPMAVMAEGGLVSKTGFFCQALLWLGSAALALEKAKSRKFSEHRRWMIRSFALTYGAVTTRLLLNFLLATGLHFDSVYDLVSWSWLLPVACGEIWIVWSSPQREVPL